MRRLGFMNITAAAVGVLMAQMGAASFAELDRSYGPRRKSHKRMTNGAPSRTFVRVTRQMQRSEFRQRNKAAYRHIRATVAFERKHIGRDVASINDRMFATGM